MNDDLEHDLEERSAIMQYDGGLSRDQAEAEAWREVMDRQRSADSPGVNR